MGQMVESASEIVDCIPNNEREIRGNLFEAGEIKAALSRVQIILGRNGVFAFVKESVPCGLCIEDVLLGPFSF
jgi:hypothetical protein